MTTIAELRFHRLDVPLLQPFGIATGTQHVANNVLIELVLSNGCVGLGEAAPFPAVSGETQDLVLAALPTVREHWIGAPAARYRYLAELAREALKDVPTALAGVEIALLDALCRSFGVSMWQWFGGAQPRLVTDLTIPTAEPAQDPIRSAFDAATRAERDGFTTLKIKVGKADLTNELLRLRAVANGAPRSRLILDANGAYDVEQALQLLDELGTLKARVALFEQPVACDATEGLIEVERKGGVPVAADESLRDVSDFQRLLRHGGPSVINIKTAKLGLFTAYDLALSAQRAGFRLMIGGMVETELSMSASACLAGGVGGFDFVDLDTPLFLGARPLYGGFTQRGAELEVCSIERGHGVAWGSRNTP